MQNDHDSVRGFPYIQFDAFISSAPGFGHGCHAVFRDDELFGRVPAPAASMGKHVYASLLCRGNCCGHCKQKDYSKDPLHAANLQKIFIPSPSPLLCSTSFFSVHGKSSFHGQASSEPFFVHEAGSVYGRTFWGVCL